MAPVQRARARAGRGRAHAAARARQVPRDLRARTSTSSSWCAWPGCTTRSTPASTRAGRTASPPRETLERISERTRELGRRHSRAWEDERAPGARRARHPRGGDRRSARAPSSRRSTGCSPSRSSPCSRRSPWARAAVPVHLEPVALDRRLAARPGVGHGDLRAREGAEGGAAALRPDRRRTPSCRSRR